MCDWVHIHSDASHLWVGFHESCSRFTVCYLVYKCRFVDVAHHTLIIKTKSIDTLSTRKWDTQEKRNHIYGNKLYSLCVCKWLALIYNILFLVSTILIQNANKLFNSCFEWRIINYKTFNLLALISMLCRPYNKTLIPLFDNVSHTGKRNGKGHICNWTSQTTDVDLGRAYIVPLHS